MARIEGVGCRDDGTILVSVKLDHGKSVVLPMSVEAAKGVFGDLGIVICKAMEINRARSGPCS